MGPRNAAFANTGNVTVLSMGLQMSDRVPPAHVKGVEPKNPAKKRNVSWAPILGASADAMIKIMYTIMVEMYTGLLPSVSEKGPANSAPAPKPTRYRPIYVLVCLFSAVSSKSTMSLTSSHDLDDIADSKLDSGL